MNLTITPGVLSGDVAPPPSKSQAHRYLIAAALAGERSEVRNQADSQDIWATRRCMAELNTKSRSLPELDCGESGSTLRFLIPLALALRGGGVFTGRGRLMDRPQKPYFDIFDERGIWYEQRDGVLTVEGRLAPGTYRLPGDVSSQFVTGLLYALPLLEGDSNILLTSPLESRGYVDMTLEVLAKFGVRVEQEGERFHIPGPQRYAPAVVEVEGDWSQAAFWLAARDLGNPVRTRFSLEPSTQGDRRIMAFRVSMEHPGDVTLDVADYPDLVPPLAVIAALRAGHATSLVNAARLRLKESDRLASVTAALNAMGAEVEEGPDFLRVRGRAALAGGCTVDCCNDHRIAMMAAIAATRCREPVTLLGAECVAKSYPDFWEHYRMLGGVFHEHTGE